jgi:HEAT repeat protein
MPEKRPPRPEGFNETADVLMNKNLSAERRMQAAAWLGETGHPDARAFLGSRIIDKKESIAVRVSAIHAAGALRNADAVKDLLGLKKEIDAKKTLSDEDASLLFAVTSALCDSRQEEAVPHVVALLDHANAEVSRRAWEGVKAMLADPRVKNKILDELAKSKGPQAKAFRGWP